MIDPELDLRVRSLVEHATAHGNEIIVLHRKSPTCAEEDDLPMTTVGLNHPRSLPAFSTTMGSLLAECLAGFTTPLVEHDGECPACSLRDATFFAYEVARGFNLELHQGMDHLAEWCTERVRDQNEEHDHG